MSASDIVKSITDLSFIDDPVMLKLLPNVFWTLLDVILEVDCVQLHMLSGINCHPLRLCLTFGRNPKMIRVKMVRQITKLGNRLLSLTPFSKRTVWIKVLLSWESHFFYIIQNLPNTLKVAKSTFLFCGVDSNVSLGPMDSGVFSCKHTLWQVCFFSGQLENTAFHHYFPQIHVILSNFPLKIQNKCQIFSVSFYHSKCVAQALQKPFCSNSPSGWVSVLIANPSAWINASSDIFCIFISPLYFTLSILFTFLKPSCHSDKVSSSQSLHTVIVLLDILCPVCLFNFTRNLVLILCFL